MRSNTITITRKEYLALREDSLFLEALEAEGVENWLGFEEALNLLEDWKASLLLIEEEG